MSQTKAQLIEGDSDQSIDLSSLVLHGSTSGTATLQATAIAGTPTLTLPDTTGTLDRLNRAGNILQVVNATYGTLVSSSSSTYADTGLTASITPTSSTSKILVLVNQAGYGKLNNTFVGFKLLRGSTDLITFEGTGAYTNTVTANRGGSCSCCYLDSPSSTSSVTYKTQLASIDNVSVVYAQAGAATSTITLLEVVA